MSDKISIRFFDNREIRAIWDDAQSKWWFSIVDVIAILTASANPRKYWSVMKTRLKKEENQLKSGRRRGSYRSMPISSDDSMVSQVRSDRKISQNEDSNSLWHSISQIL